jgi:ribosome maturation factor RimP
MGQTLQTMVETTLEGMGYELVELEFAGAGLLRVYLDTTASADRAVTIEDCEAVSRQLTRLFEVENVNYQRLEVSSPGLDRLLSRQSDFERFAGELVTVKLRVALGGRKNFEGVLVRDQDDAQGTAQFGIEYDDTKNHAAEQARLRMSFTLADVDKARLVPQVIFKKQKVKNEGNKQ